MSTDTPSVEDHNKALKQIEELNAQLRERNEALKEAKAKATTNNDPEGIQAIVKEVVSAELSELAKSQEEIKKQNEELKVALAGKPQVPLSSGGSDVPSSTPPKWTAEQLAYFEKMKLDPNKVLGNVK